MGYPSLVLELSTCGASFGRRVSKDPVEFRLNYDANAYHSVPVFLRAHTQASLEWAGYSITHIYDIQRLYVG